RGDPILRQRARALQGLEAPPPVEVPPQLKATLRPYQQEGVDWLQNLRAHGVGGVLADDMGLGKTLQTIAHILTERVSGRMKTPVLVVAPTSVAGNWKRELAKFAPCLSVVEYHGAKRASLRGELAKADVVISSYPIVTRDLEELKKHNWHMLVLDEAQIIKNPRSQAHKAAKALEAEYRLCLSGTPIENNLEELWALFDFVLPGLLGSVQQFRTAFRTPIERMGSSDRLNVLRRRVAPFILRRMKESVARDLPPKTEIVRTVGLAGDQRELHEAIRIAAHAEVRKVVRKKGIAASTIDILGALMKLRQVCCDPTLVPVKAAREVERSAKLEALLEMLDEQLASGRRILIFSQFTSMLAIIAERLREREVRYVSLTGATADRNKQVDTFQDGKAEVFLISLKAGGTGLNLTRADTVIHFDPWWNPQAQAQATDRAHRIGQRNPVFVYNLIVSGSVEERMLALQQRKRELADGLLAPGGETSELSERDVEDLFAPLQ
ncbi:MAG: DEAD/DEAH box helicase, partial [Nannocystaceae bacterium]|nr:DEAD/DEAH box helicase [Nannocystaceae bacterium]